jgi:hypothetical protein
MRIHINHMGYEGRFFDHKNPSGNESKTVQKTM